MPNMVVGVRFDGSRLSRTIPQGIKMHLLKSTSFGPTYFNSFALQVFLFLLEGVVQPDAGVDGGSMLSWSESWFSGNPGRSDGALEESQRQQG